MPRYSTTVRHCRHYIPTLRQSPTSTISPTTRRLSNKPPSLTQRTDKATNTSANNSTTSSQHHTRLNRILSRLPTRLQRYTTSLRVAPLSHVLAFLLLHEITAVAPLFGLAATFHYTNWLPPVVSEGRWVADGMEMFGRWFRRRGWFGETAAETKGVRKFNLDGDDGTGAEETVAAIPVLTRREKWWGRSEVGVRIIVETATAWAIVKALLPLRLVLSVWGTPWFARAFVIPCSNWLGKRLPFFSMKKG